jgi:hypothetical protein
VYRLTSNVGVFQSVGAGNFYLATSSPYRNAGTTNITPALLTNLWQRTTYPPLVISNLTVSTDLTLSPQAQRDTDQPDIKGEKVSVLTKKVSVLNGG